MYSVVHLTSLAFLTKRHPSLISANFSRVCQACLVISRTRARWRKTSLDKWDSFCSLSCLPKDFLVFLLCSLSTINCLQPSDPVQRSTEKISRKTVNDCRKLSPRNCKEQRGPGNVRLFPPIPSFHGTEFNRCSFGRQKSAKRSKFCWRRSTSAEMKGLSTTLLVFLLPVSSAKGKKLVEHK